MQTDAAQTREILTGETHLAHHTMRALRTTYESEQEFVEHVDGVLRPAGYRLLGAFSPDRETAVAVTGFRVGDNLAWASFFRRSSSAWRNAAALVYFIGWSRW
ncbi:MAG TPA: hypothetical protein VFC30_07215 [Solirubrobacteraceae bacterium]|nr:hypothetical protein [Solirubrobacteraceae bacterium]